MRAPWRATATEFGQNYCKGGCELWRLIGRIKKMAINPMKLLELKNLWNAFTRRHPKFPQFISTPYSRPAFPKETVIEFRSPHQMAELSLPTLKVQQEDIEAVKSLQITSKYLAKFHLDFTIFLHKKIVFLLKILYNMA